MSDTLRFEIVRTAQTQWHWRIVSNGRILASSENYKRKVGAEKAINAIAHVFHGWIDGDDPVTCMSDRNSWEKTNRPSAELRYIDDRLKPLPRPELPTLEQS